MFPYAGLAWAVFKVDPAGDSPRAGGLSFVFTKPAVMVASVRALKGVHVTAEAFTADEDDARQAAEKTNRCKTSSTRRRALPSRMAPIPT